MRKHIGGSLDGQWRGLLKHDNLPLFKVLVSNAKGANIETYRLKDGVRHFESAEPYNGRMEVRIGEEECPVPK